MERKSRMSKEKKKKTTENSEEKDILQEKQNAQENEESSVDEDQPKELSELEKAYLTISQLEQQLQESKNDYLKAYADAQNTKKRLMADFDNKSKFILKTFALEIVSVIDNFERALLDEHKDVESLRKGIEMIYSQLLEALKKEGIEKIDAHQQPFDANMHHAIAIEESDEVDENTVIEVFQEGYMIKDKLLRPSVVKVSERKSDE